MGKRKNKKPAVKNSSVLSFLMLIIGAVMMVKAFDIAQFTKTNPDYVFLASMGLIFYSIFNLFILPLFEKDDNNRK